MMSFSNRPESYTVSDRDPKSLARSKDGLFLISTLTELILLRDGKKVGSLFVSNEPLTADFHPTRPEVAVGGKVS